MYRALADLEDKKLLDGLVKKGIISITIVGHKLVYEAYLKELKTTTKARAVENTHVSTKVPESTIYRIIQKMEA